jgi:4-hydroxy-tetrahydrodipicolinate reductase
MIKICVAGATGRMGSTLIKEAIIRHFDVVGAIAASDDPNIGKTLKEADICDSNIIIVDNSQIKKAVQNADVYISFTSPNAEVVNLPIVASMEKKIVMGTTGLTEKQMEKISNAVSDKVPAVFSPNFSIGVNTVFALTKSLALLPSDYDSSISEIHHTGKKDAPSGTAVRLGELVSKERGYSTVVYGRKGTSVRKQEEIEIESIRAGGVPGIHNLIIAGPHEMIRIEHIAFSRNVFAQGALFACEWVHRQKNPQIYSMADVMS